MLTKIFHAIRALLTRKVIIECDRIPYHFSNVPMKKILNWIRLEASIYLRSKKPWGLPTHLQVEPTALCNLRCALCPVTEGMNRPVGHMGLDLFKKLIDEIGDYVFLVLLWDWGEPFINPDIYGMIKYAKRKGIKVVSSTNGHMFAQAKHADQVVQSGLDSLIFAVDGISQETYERYRRSGDFKTVLQGIKAVVARKHSLNSITPFLNFRFIVMKHNEHEIPGLKVLAKSLGVDALTLKTLNPHSNDTYGSKRSDQEASENEFIPSDRHYRRFVYEQYKNVPILRKHNPCKNLWNSPSIHWNGKVCSCTYDYNEKHIFGDLNKDAFRAIWFGNAYQGMRRQFRNNWEKLDPCNQCSYAHEGGSCIDEHIADAFFFKQNRGVK
ncbi:radical SAM/SPASM domain-containing protein [Candidatus Omnitrophota bacterium]